jgi:hypothetical protein
LTRQVVEFGPGLFLATIRSGTAGEFVERIIGGAAFRESFSLISIRLGAT